MSKRQLPDTAQLQHMNVLLEVALELPEEDREAWLQALPPQHRALTPSLRVLLQRASEETDGFMRRSVGWLRWPQAGSASPPALGRDAHVGAATPGSSRAMRPHQLNPRAMTPRSPPDTHQLQQLNPLLQAALELPEPQREAWLQALPAQQRALAPLLRAMLQRASVETGEFMRRPVGLAAMRPYRAERHSAAALEDAITHADIAPASARVTGDRKLARRLRGDLDTIIDKALRKESAQRYPSVESMAADLRRHLGGEPVSAQPPSWHYRARRFVGRHRIALTALSAVGVSLAVGLGAALWQAHEARRFAAVAQSQLQMTQATLDFTTRVLTEGLSAGESLTLGQLIRRSEAMTESRFAADPAERLTAADAVATWHHAFGNYERSERLLTRVLASLPAGLDPSAVGELRCKRAFARAKQGRAAEAAAEIDDVLAGLRPDDYGAVGCLQLRGLVATGSGDAAGALRFASRALTLFDVSGRSSEHDRAQLTVDLAHAHSQNGQPALADARFREAHDQIERLGRSESAFAVSLHASWGVALADAGQPRAALEQFERASLIAARRAPDGEVPLALHNNRGNVLRWLGRSEEALDAHQRALARARRDGNPSALMQSLANTAIDLLRLQRVDDAQVLVKEGEALLQQGNHPSAGSAAMSLRNASATLRRVQSRWREADDALAAMQATYEQSRSAGLATVLVDRSKIALIERRTADALQLAERALAMAENSRGDLPHSASSGEAWLAVARAHHAAGDAAAARDACTQAVRHFAATVDPSHPSLADARALVAMLG